MPGSDKLGFFEQRSTSNAIYRVASKRTDLTIFVGLGASLASGLPTWDRFAHSVVEHLGTDSNPVPAAKQGGGSAATDGSLTPLERIFDAEDLLTTMEIARASWPESQFLAAMVPALYGRPPAMPERAMTHEAIAELAVRWHQTNPDASVTILTTNYDLLLERALHRLPPSVLEPAALFGSSEVLEPNTTNTSPYKQFAIGCTFPKFVANPTRSSNWLTSHEGGTHPVRVIHLHGVVTPDDVEGHVVATSSDYYRDSKSHETARGLLTRALTESTCLFLGTSLSDPLILGHLYNAAEARGIGASEFSAMHSGGADLTMPYEAHWQQPDSPLAAVLFSRESFPWAVSQEVDQQTRRQLEERYSAMWRQLRLAVVWSDFYSQPYQFLREVSFRRARLAEQGEFNTKRQKTTSSRNTVPPEVPIPGDIRSSYGERIDAWSKLYLEDALVPRRHRSTSRRPREAVDRYKWQQANIRDFLQRYRDRAMDHLLNVQDPVATGEDWKLDLWVRSPGVHAIVRVASTQYEFLTAPHDSVMYPLGFQSELPAVRAFANGAISEEEGLGRWSYYVALPIRQTPEVPSITEENAILSRATWGDIPVGALVVASSSSREESLLSRRPQGKVREVLTLLQAAGNEIVSFEGSEYPP